MAQFSTSPLSDIDTVPLDEPVKKCTLPENEAETLEQFVRDMGLSATLRALADLAGQWSKQDTEYRAHWDQICLAIHTCAGVKVEPLLADINEKPKSLLSLDTYGAQTVVHI